MDVVCRRCGHRLYMSYALDAFEESGDLKRLLGLRDQLELVREDLEKMKRDYKPQKA